QIGANAIGVGYRTKPTKTFINTAHHNGIEIWKWTVNDENKMQILMSRGIDGIITNFPNKALAVRKKLLHPNYSQNVSNTSLSKKDLINKKVKALLAKMSLEDKVGEMTQLALDMICVGDPYNLKEPLELDPEKMRKVLVDLKVGSILNNGGHAHSRAKWFEIISAIQDMAMKEKKSGIPVLYGIDAIHGVNYTSDATLFPQEINLAATWNPELVKKLAQVSAYETRASAIPWTFAPVLDIGRDPRWPRFWETFGEDVFLASQMGRAFVEGNQGDDIASPYHVATCMKHFLGYSFPWTGKDRTTAYIPERQLREYFVPTFQTAIDAGAKTVMINSGEMNGIPVHANPKILKELLRDDMGFNGLAVSDWEDIKYLYTRHHVAKDYKEAIKMAINAGIDMSMVPTDLEFPVLLKELVTEGKVPMDRIDEAVSRILTLKFELNLFENPLGDQQAFPDFASAKHQALALQGASESIVLLKNDNNILPIDKNKKIFITGPTAHSLNAINGGWTGTWQGNDPKYNTPNKQSIYEAVKKQFGAANVNYLETKTNLAASQAAARNADLAIICIGEMSYTEKPGDLKDMNLPEAQIQLVQAIAKTNTPIILILVEGRPRIVRKIEPLAKAVLYAGLPSNEGGLAIAQILSGDYNPNGKLAFTYPRFANDLLTYDHKKTDDFGADFSFNAFHPQWAFGHGLSYTSFVYKNLKLEELENGKYTVSVNLTNTGHRKGMETIQLYIHDKVASITPPVKRLRAFRKVELDAGESKTFSFSITSDDLKFVGRDNEWTVEPGRFELMIDKLKTSFVLK
ncbi:MAG TPA: beta-glucosidase, partial [Saprospiraceae bacterium]|nr:beta-glucosidase [Saprospiraceae bacterium]